MLILVTRKPSRRSFAWSAQKAPGHETCERGSACVSEVLANWSLWGTENASWPRVESSSQLRKGWPSFYRGVYILQAGKVVGIYATKAFPNGK